MIFCGAMNFLLSTSPALLKIARYASTHEEKHIVCVNTRKRIVQNTRACLSPAGRSVYRKFTPDFVEQSRAGEGAWHRFGRAAPRGGEKGRGGGVFCTARRCPLVGDSVSIHHLAELSGAMAERRDNLGGVNHV